MFTHFTPAQHAVHYPADRRLYIGLRKEVWYIICLTVVIFFGAAWLQYLIQGLPADPSAKLLNNSKGSSGFPWWVVLCHWVNFFFLILLIRSGLSVLADHPRLYWNNSCRPGTEWLRFTPVNVPPGKLWTAKEDARYLSPMIGLPGYKHTVGVARHWHFISVPFFLLNGVVFIILLFLTDHWQRIVPVSWSIIPDAWSVFVYYATFNMPIEPNGYFHYNALQQLSYFAIVFLFAPLAMLSGMAMSPAIENRFHWLPKLFINRQGARSVHFLVMLGYLAFTLVHVFMVAATGLKRNMNHITLGTDDAADPMGMYFGGAILMFVIAFCFFAHWVSWRKPRFLQRLAAFINGNLWLHSINKLKPKSYFEKKDITPYFWSNGKIPESKVWNALAEGDFKDYKLKIGGLVEHQVELSLEDLKALAKEQNITMHHCIQGWSGIAEWGGIPIRKLVDLVKPHDSVQTVVFYSYGEGLYGGVYYDTHTLDNCLKPASILAWEMNYAPLPVQYGAPLRLRIENQLGYKLVKWIERIEFVESHTTVGKGYGGKNEDDEYFDLIANS
ncbi:molybdopterin-dependent oxidoreductase [Sphingobacterium shayense]|uniref:molybdopterin-dependent oxidoreductase n=1 Tax=Sphingobacterium shayense TaxID=626343 RepID=UPI0015521775|nr:molybdopterin-dependent oxidoreductase [Sphingobacterium shayense]NQD71408.1 molybdopterin-dependent oxidoreductase [Sphingobacterium shayense]